MKNIVYLLLLLTLCNGCGRTVHQLPGPAIQHGMSTRELLRIWGRPVSRTLAGFTRIHNYPVEVWEYLPKQNSGRIIIILVDEEVYLWGEFSNREIAEHLAALELYQPKTIDSSREQNRLQLQKTTEDALNAQRTNQLMQQINQQETTQQHLRDMQQRRVLQQQPLYMPAVLPPPKIQQQQR